MMDVQENNIIVVFENGTSLVLDVNAHEILRDIKQQHKNIKIFMANEIIEEEEEYAEERAEEGAEEKQKKMITIIFQNGNELDLEDPTDEMIAEIISKFDNSIIIEKPNKKTDKVENFPIKNSEKKMTKKDVQNALLKPGTPINGEVLPPLALFALYHTLSE